MLKEEISVSTDDIFFILQNTEDISAELEKIPDDIETMGFCGYLSELMKKSSTEPPKLAASAHLSRSFAYQVCAGDRLPNRDIVLRIAFALKLNIDETQRLLKLANRGILYPRIKRDAVLIYAISHKYGLSDAEDLLEKKGQRTLFGEAAG